MNDSQRRREQLLKETRSQYSSHRQIPAVHPRYGAVYKNLYGEDEAPVYSSLGIRIVICLTIFGFFAAADYKQERIYKFTPSQIVSEIEKQPDFSTFLNDFQ